MEEKVLREIDMSKITVTESRMWKQFLMGTKKNYELRKESSVIHWAPPGKVAGTAGIWDVGTDIIIKVTSKAELCAYIIFIIIQTCLPQMWNSPSDTNTLWLVSPSFPPFHLPFRFSFSQCKNIQNHWYPNLGKLQIYIWGISITIKLI